MARSRSLLIWTRSSSLSGDIETRKVLFIIAYFFNNWVDSTDWRPQDLAMMTPEQREGYEQRLLRERPKYIPMKHEDVARLSPEDRQEYENSLKITKTPRRYALRSRPY